MYISYPDYSPQYFMETKRRIILQHFTEENQDNEHKEIATQIWFIPATFNMLAERSVRKVFVLKRRKFSMKHG